MNLIQKSSIITNYLRNAHQPDSRIFTLTGIAALLHRHTISVFLPIHEDSSSLLIPNLLSFLLSSIIQSVNILYCYSDRLCQRKPKMVQK